MLALTVTAVGSNGRQKARGIRRSPAPQARRDRERGRERCFSYLNKKRRWFGSRRKDTAKQGEGETRRKVSERSADNALWGRRARNRGTLQQPRRARHRLLLCNENCWQASIPDRGELLSRTRTRKPHAPKALSTMARVPVVESRLRVAPESPPHHHQL